MCSCNIEKVNYPQTYEWGPPIWKTMHAMSLKAGNISIPSCATMKLEHGQLLYRL